MDISKWNKNNGYHIPFLPTIVQIQEMFTKILNSLTELNYVLSNLSTYYGHLQHSMPKKHNSKVLNDIGAMLLYKMYITLKASI